MKPVDGCVGKHKAGKCRREFKRGFLREFKRGQIQSEYFPRISGPVLRGGFGGSETAQNWRRG